MNKRPSWAIRPVKVGKPKRGKSYAPGVKSRNPLGGGRKVVKVYGKA